jgi:hypothetical protein
MKTKHDVITLLIVNEVPDKVADELYRALVNDFGLDTVEEQIAEVNRYQKELLKDALKKNRRQSGPDTQN